ncbi:MAG TPA: sigma-70 family RNA polymerase sigma factor [Anaerolineales bacterium]|nr:sigma-70 family RNA polymerase sigma factor [Anaerolineales bacterium]
MPALDVEALVREYARPIHAYLWRLTGDAQVAEDCLQDTFLRAVRAAASGTQVAQPRAWLYAVATNSARDHARKASRRLQREQLLDSDLVDRSDAPPEAAARSDQLRRVADAVRRLPPKQRAALLMRKYQELDYDEVAAALDCSPATARANVYQALRRLRAWLSDEEEA